MIFFCSSHHFEYIHIAIDSCVCMVSMWIAYTCSTETYILVSIPKMNSFRMLSQDNIMFDKLRHISVAVFHICIGLCSQVLVVCIAFIRFQNVLFCCYISFELTNKCNSCTALCKPLHKPIFYANITHFFSHYNVASALISVYRNIYFHCVFWPYSGACFINEIHGNLKHLYPSLCRIEK